MEISENNPFRHKLEGTIPEPRSSLEGDMSLRKARELLMEDRWEGTDCPCCDQFAKVYERGIHATTASEMIRFWRIAGQNWSKPIDVIGKNSPDLLKCRFWKLLEREEGFRSDGSNRVGIWRITDKGVAFIKGEISVPEKALIYNNKLLGFTENQVTIQDCLKDKFNYSELMSVAVPSET